MPAFSSKKQYRMMMAILHGKSGKTKRGDSGPPKSVAAKYSGSGKDLVESKGKELHGGRWDGKKEKKLKKTNGGTGVVVVNEKGQVLMGRQVNENYVWSFPGGSVEAGETLEQAALRELEEETGVKLEDPKLVQLDAVENSFLIRLDYTPSFHSTEELTDVGFYDLDTIDVNKVRNCCIDTLMAYLNLRLKKGRKPLSLMLFKEEVEKLQKNIIRSGQVADAVYELRHGDALKLIGNGVFRALKRGVNGMTDDDIRDIKFGSYTIHLRKHANDIYSGRIDDGLKTIHQFINRSLPALTGELMSVFEWYNDDEEPELEIVEENKLPDEIIEDGILKLVDNYRNHNIADIYQEMENIREEIRHGNAVDVQQVEQRIMSLFDKIEERLDIFKVKHNSLAFRAGEEIDELERKLLQLQSKVDELSKKPSQVEAFSTNPPNPNEVFSEYYEYLSKPRVVVKPNGHIIIDFNSDWTNDDKTNFLHDMKAKAIKQ